MLRFQAQASVLHVDLPALPDQATVELVPRVELDTRLRRENEQLRMERDILKKALGIFSRMPE